MKTSLFCILSFLVCGALSLQPVLKNGCPDTTGIITTCEIKPNSCIRDSACGKGQKCCRFGCGKQCVNVGPVIIKPPPVRPICTLPAVTGRCRAHFPSWFYNIKTGKCESFVYGGCRGNANRFPTERECKRSCGKPIIIKPPMRPDCTLPAVVGPCEAAIRSWFFNIKSGKCERFTYGGCKGNSNRFQNKRSCERTCGRVTKPVPGSCPRFPITLLLHCPSKNQCRRDSDCRRTPGTKCCTDGRGCRSCIRPIGIPPVLPQPVCALRIDRGRRCRNRRRSLRYGFNKKTGRCERFSFYSCGGNKNNFRTMKLCSAKCGGKLPFPPTKLSTCKEPKIVGRCKARMPRFWFNHRTGRCERFFYGGCGANRNNFITESKCRAVCRPGPVYRG